MGFTRRPGGFQASGDTLDEQNNFFSIDPRSSFVTADLSLLQARLPGPAVSDVVFIDSSVPDIQDLLNGLEPGEKAFVIDAGSDGLDQIAGILKSEHLSNLNGIQIVAHGSAGELKLGSTSVTDSALADHASALATIGSALASGGDLSLYACDTAQGASGQQFIADLSHLAGANVAAATHDIGQTPDGENWTLDATTGGAAAPAAPFTAQALADFEGTLTTGVFRVPVNSPNAEYGGFNHPQLVTLGNGDIAFAFQDNSGDGGNGTVDVRVFDQNGAPVGSEVDGSVGLASDQLVVNGSTSSTFWVLAPVQNPQTGIYYEITAQEMTVSGNTVTAGAMKTPVNNTGGNEDNSGISVVKLSNGDYVLAWAQTDIPDTNPNDPNFDQPSGGRTVAQVFDSNFNALSGLITISSGSSSQPYNTFLYASTNGTTVDVTWTTAVPIGNNNTSNEEFGVSFGVASGGASLTGLTSPVNLTSSLPSGVESWQQTELANGNILVMYTSNEGSSFSPPLGDLYGEIFGPGFTNPQTPFIIADAAEAVAGHPEDGTYEPLEAHASLFPSGAYIVTYERGLSTFQQEIYARIYNSDNTPLTNEFLVTSPATNIVNQNPEVAVANGTGGIAITWETVNPTLGVNVAQDVDARIYSDVGPISNGAGTKITDIFDNTTPASAAAVSSLITGGQYTSILGHAFGGIAIVGNAATAAQGTWEWSSNGGGTWNSISTAVSDTSATILSPTDLVRFVPAANFSGAPGSLTTLVWDGQDGFSANTTGNDISQSIFDTSDITQTTESFTGAFAGTSVAFSTNIIGLNEAETGTVLAGATLSKSTAGTGVLGDATNLDGHTLSVALVGGSSGNVGHSVTGTYGNLTLNSDGTYSYAANNAAAIAAISGSHPVDTFNYTVADDQGVTANATLTITVDRAPVATADTNTAKVNGAAVTGNVVTNDTDQDNDTLTVTAITDSSHGSGTVGSNLLGQYGTLKLNANGTYTYTANTSISAPTGSHATDVFTYTESDGFTGTATQTLTVTLDRVPVAVADTNTVVVGGSPATGNVTTNDTNLDGDTLTVTDFTDGSSGTVGTLFHGTYGDLTLNSDGSYTYTLGATVGEQTALTNAATGSHATEVVTYTESDGSFGDTMSANLTITIDRLPVAVADTKTVAAGATANGNVITNDSDPDGDTLTVTGFTDGSSGTVGSVFHGTYGDLTLNSNGSYTYSAGATVGEQTALANAATGSHATEVVTYTASDGHGGTASSTLTINLDRLPVAIADTTSAVSGGTAATGSVLTNDSDPDGDALTVTGFTDGSSGTIGTVFHGIYGDLTLNANGSYTYSAGATVGEQTALANATTGSHATETVTYTESDGFGGTTSSTLTITLDRLPVAVADTNTDVAGATATGNVLTNDSDPDGDTLSVTGFTDGTSGTVGTVFHGTYGDLTLNADGSYSYSAGATVGEQTALANAATGSHATEVVTYTESDGHGGTAFSTLTITLDRLPAAVADANSTVAEGTAATGNVLTNDSDPDGDTLNVTGFTDGSSGTVGTLFHGTYGDLTLNSNGAYSYTSGATVGEQTAIANAATGSHPTEIVTYTESDGHGGTASSTLSIDVDRAPVITLNVPSEIYTALSPAEALQGGASITDPDGSDAIASAKVTLTGGYAGDGDLLSYNGTVGTVTLTDGSQYSVVYGGAGTASETLTITTTSGTGTQADYDQLVNGVVFSSTATDPTNAGANPGRSASFQVTDAGGATSAQTEIIQLDQPPTLSSVAASAAWTEEGAVTTLSPSITVSDPDSTQMSSATVSVAGGTFANDQDVLAATGNGTIAVSYNSSTEILVLTGLDTKADYQSVLDSVTFHAGENPTDFGSNPTRIVSWVVTDDVGASSTPQTTTVSLTNVNDPPTLSNVAAQVSFVDGSTVTVSPAASVSDPDNLDLAGATVSITGGAFAGDGDVLAADTAGTGIIASYNSSTETLTLAGSDTLAHYQSVLDSITYSSGADPINGGADPTRTLSWVVDDGSGSNNLSAATTTTITIAAAVRDDFNADGLSDLLFRFGSSPNSGTFTEWQSTGSGFTPNVDVDGTAAPAWTLAGIGDFNNDGNADLVWQNGVNFAEWQSTGNGFTPNVYVQGVSPGWNIVGVDDFNGDGKADLLWQNGGTFTEWQSTGNGFTPNVFVGAVDTGWTLGAIGDFNGDGKGDLIFQNGGGTFTEWQSTGNGFTPNVFVGSVGPGWTLAGVGDFTGNGKDDLLWLNSSTGQFTVWDSTGNGFTPNSFVGSVGTGWTLAGVGDYNGDHKDDLLWRNTSTGTISEWQSTGAAFTQNATVISSVSTNWTLLGNPTHTHP